MGKRITQAMRRDGYGQWHDRRKEKRHHRKLGMLDPLYEAWTAGQALAYYGARMPARLQRNPYPPGRRHDEFERGYALADPMGDHHGRNE